ncbi:LicD family protein [Lacticaseibacillus paracasei]|uniref:LicD family protein n=1 Tax=Lacticaseibacillus paracasei TaxID=1597 RepID=UPI0021A82374|nr:LicD family protein [Lacticaseibacillus paracasei]MCT4384162.1 2-C-methyl-D-erythritol 4-phosphate cytidylyltransferase [Lacticaseibacillus paracasei]
MTKIVDLSQATADQIRALQLKELEILKYVAELCVAHGLTYYMCGGTCIGTIRHHGFIPWDDDVDIFMVREDYEKLYHKWTSYSTDPKYELCRSDAIHNYHHAAMTVNDSSTTFINLRTQNEDVNQGIAIDIIPIDHQAPTVWKRMTQRLNAILFSIFINQRLPDHQGRFLRALTALPLNMVKSPKTRYRIWKKAEKRMTKPQPNSKNLVELVSGMKGLFRTFDPDWFASTIQMPFEDTMMPVMVGYDQYLTLVFHDYMTIPPKNEQLAKHKTAMIDTETPYLQYRGTEYLVSDPESRAHA